MSQLPSVDPSRRIGSVELGGFRIEALIAQGSFGAVYRASQLGTDRAAVVKVAHAHLLQNANALRVRRRFEEEMRAATRVSHPNLVTVYVSGVTTDGVPAIAMELLRGETLGAALSRSARPTFEALRPRFLEIGAALAAVHAAGIVHRDVSPENIMLCGLPGEPPYAKLLDFGIAHIDGRGSGPQTAVGTPRYMAPEQLFSQPEPRSDVFGLGALLWWAATGREYLDEEQDSSRVLRALLDPHRSRDPRSVDPDVSAPLAALVSEMLAESPASRPGAEEFVRRLAEVPRQPARRVSVPEPTDSWGAEPEVPASALLVTTRREVCDFVSAACEGLPVRLSVSTSALSHLRAPDERGCCVLLDAAALGVELPVVLERLAESAPRQRRVVLSAAPLPLSVAALASRVFLLGQSDEGLRNFMRAAAASVIERDEPVRSGVGELIPALVDVIETSRASRPPTSPARVEPSRPPSDPLRVTLSPPAATPRRALASDPNETAPDLSALQRRSTIRSVELDGRLAVLDAEARRAYTSAFVGEMPELLLTLHHAAERAHFADACSRIAAAAEPVGAVRLARLAQTAIALHNAGELGDTAPFAEDLEGAFQRAFRAIASLDG